MAILDCKVKSVTFEEDLKDLLVCVLEILETCIGMDSKLLMRGVRNILLYCS